MAGVNICELSVRKMAELAVGTGLMGGAGVACGLRDVWIWHVAERWLHGCEHW